MIHKKRRDELLSILGDDAVVIVSTNSEQKRNSDVNYPFRPDSSFWYLTGFIEPDAIAVFSKNNYSIFLRPKDKTQEIWNGVRLGVDLAPETLLVDNAYDINTFTDEIKKKYYIKDDSQIPDISRFGPVAQAIGMRPGDMCHIIRPSKTSVQTSFYRICSA